jgi:hypothetical protein
MEGGTRQKPLIHYSIGDYRAYVSFSGYFSLNDIQLEKISEYAPQDSILHDIADKLSVIKSKYQGEIGGIISTGWRGNTVNAEPELDFTDENEFLSDADCESIQDAIRDFAGWILSCLQREFEYTQSAEYIAETMESNGYEFDGYGNIV